MSARKQWDCTRCSKKYAYKGGLSAHIKRKHPLSSETNKKNKSSQPSAPVPASPLIVQDLISIDTQELEGLLEDEQEFYEILEEFEHGVGVNESMVDWYQVNFQSSFSNTGEFENRTAVLIKPINCDDCKVNSTTFEKQRELLLKQDKQIQDSHRIQKESDEEIKKLKSLNKSLDSRLQETTSMLETVLEETTLEIKTLKEDIKTKDALLVTSQSKKTAQTVKNTSRKENDLEISLEKCKVCGFSSNSRVVMNKHMESKHSCVKVFKCLMCPLLSKSKQSFMEHKAKHQKELDVITMKDVCKDCNISFGSREDYLEHLLEKHRNRENSSGTSKTNHVQETEECQNGPSCKWLKNNRCMYEHQEQPWKTVHTKKKRQQPKQQHQQKEPQQQEKHPRRQTQQNKSECRNGPTCIYLKYNKCSFAHKSARPQAGHGAREARQHPRSGAQQHGGSITQLKQCKFGSRCDRGRNCGYLHLAKDFLPRNAGGRN